MKYKHLIVTGALALATGAFVAQAAGVGGKLEVFSWWTAGGESEGLDALFKIMKTQNPDVEIVNATVAGGGGTNAQAVLRTRVLGGNPPDSFQVHGGSDILDNWVKAGKMEDISAIWTKNGYDKVIPKGIQAQFMADGKFYGMPVNIHRNNNLYFNNALLAKAGVKAPTTLAQFWIAADKLKKAGITPLALGSQGNWEITMLLENLLVASGGAGFYNDLTAGKIAWTDARVIKALTNLKRMMGYVNKDHAALSWDQGAGLVLNGKAAFNIMGDWAKGYFLSNKWTADKEFSSIPAPGTLGTFIATNDAFGQPTGAPNQAAVAEWLKLLGSKEGQEQFNIKKGSICARTDCDPKLFDPIGQRTMKDFSSNAIVATIAHGSAMKGSFVSALHDEMGVFALKGDVQQTAANLEKQAKDLGIR
jgi:glucose/mannose transport system substrate-binding protein